jgi:hypothetical protein
MVVCLPVIAVMILARHLLLQIMGADVGVAAEALVIMAAAQLVIAILPARDTLLAMSGHGAQLRTLSLMQGVVIGVGCVCADPAVRRRGRGPGQRRGLASGRPGRGIDVAPPCAGRVRRSTA